MSVAPSPKSEIAEAEFRRAERHGRHVYGQRTAVAVVPVRFAQRALRRRLDHLDGGRRRPPKDRAASIVEKAQGRAIRQEISRIKNRPENVGAVLTEETDRLVQDYDSIVRPHAPKSTNDRFDALLGQVREALRHGRPDDARKSHSEMFAIFINGAKEHPGFQVDLFLAFSRERHLAIDKGLHDRLVADGQACIDRNDLEGLRRTIGRILENQMPTTAKNAASAALAGLMK